MSRFIDENKMLLSSLSRVLPAALWVLFAQPCRSGDFPRIENQSINESSGLAFSTRSDEILFTHNDSGDKPRLFAFDRAGKTVAEISVIGAEALDWEDLCSFQRDGQHWLAVGDIGDNSAKRDHVAIYVFAEPELREGTREYHIPLACTLKVRYPRRPTDCEALAYDVVSDNLVLLTKESLGCEIFTVTLPRDFRGVAEVTAKSAGRLTIPLVTAADISRDGQQLVICTYGPVCLMPRNLADGQSPWRFPTGAELPFFPMPARKQGEAICFSPDARHLWLTSEHLPAPLIEVQVPQLGPPEPESRR